jgi:uroporphyrinogen decarboxylase
MRYMGGFDKRILAQGPAAIDAEIDRLAAAICEGGFIPFCDHRGARQASATLPQPVP